MDVGGNAVMLERLFKDRLLILCYLSRDVKEVRNKP